MISHQPISGLLGEVFTPRYPRRYVGRHRRLGGATVTTAAVADAGFLAVIAGPLRRLARTTMLSRS